MSIKSRIGSFLQSLAAIPARVGKFLLPGRKSAEKGRPSARMIVVLYLLIIAAIIGAYSLRGPLGEILIRADPFPFNLEEGEDENGEEVVDGKDSPFTDVFAPEGSTGGESGEHEGAEEALPVFAPASTLLWPLDGAVLVKHGEMFRVENQYRAHIGIDIEAHNGAKVKAAWHGTVKETGNSLLLGQYVLVNHGDQYLTFYANLGSISVREGTVVKAGDELGTVGSSAIVDAGPGNHLHFTVYLVEKDGDIRREVPLDPLEFLNQG
jgi:murein DD-endopeptidase MepM/ murein hydrolase activator NlpD